MNDRSACTQVSYSGTSVHNGNNIEHNTNIYYNGGSMPINLPKKRYTNKKLIVPFTKEASNGAQGGTYVQRDDLLGKIADSFEAQAGKKRMVFLSGMGGSGKSELARAYAESHSGEYDEIFWLTCRDGVKPELFGLMAEANMLEKVEKTDAAAFSDKVLIIIDNCNSDDGKFLFTVEHSTGDADILITTRLGSIGGYQDFLLPVESDDRETFAYSVFKNNYCKKPKRGNPKKIEDRDVPSVHAICREVQYNTMMVSLIGIRLREYGDLSIPACAKKIREGVGKLDGKVRYSKDLDSRAEEIKDILVFLFADILKHNFSEAEKAVLTVLSLTSASWYGIDYIVSLCRGTGKETEYVYAIEELLDLGWLQGSWDSMAIHPLIAEVISDNQITERDPKFFEGLLENYLGMPNQYLGRERFLITKILTLGVKVQPEYRLAVMLLINHGSYKKLFTELFPEVRAAYFVYVNHDERRRFLYRNLEKEEICPLIDVPCLDEGGKHAELLKVINMRFPYNLDLSIVFCGKEISIIPNGFCWNDCFLRNIAFSKKLKKIGDGAFRGCSGLSGELHLPKGVTSIGNSAFSGCSGLSGKLCFPEGVKSVEDFTFYGCSGLSGELHLPKGLTSIGNSAFHHCSSLKGELHLPEGVTSIGNSAFSGCSTLSGRLSLPEGVTRIEDFAFYGCSGLSGELSLPKGLTSIGDYAFNGCIGLRGELRLPKGVTSIGISAFAGCSGLSGKLHLPECVKSIGNFAFSHCSGLSGELCLPDGLTSIGDGAFNNCKALGKIIFYNPNTAIKGILNKHASTIICGYSNSTAEKYAKMQGLVFEEL